MAWLQQISASSLKAFCLSSQERMNYLISSFLLSFLSLSRDEGGVIYPSFVYLFLDISLYKSIRVLAVRMGLLMIRKSLYMQERQEQEAFPPAPLLEEPELITIDEKWVAKDSFLKLQLITCPVCYCIPLDYPRECDKCERIFCHTDYEIISVGDNRCPNCKAEPWGIKKEIHISYKHMFDSIIFKCDLCPPDSKEEYKKSELISHLENEHNRYLSDQSILYDYTFINEKGQESKLNLIQNIEINFKRNEGMAKFQIAGNAGRVLSIDLKEMLASHNQLGKCKIVRERSKTIKKNYQYLVWIVNISDPDQTDERIVFYSEELQGIIEKNYQDYERNERFNEFCMDVRDTRYRISFSNKSQINTYTRAEKRIMRLSVIFR